MGGFFSTPSKPAQIYWGKWSHEKKNHNGKVIASKILIIHPNGSVRSMGVITDEDGTSSSFDTGDIQVDGWVEPGDQYRPSIITGGFLTGISKKIQMTPLGDLHVVTDESAESLCAGGRTEPLNETYHKK